MVGLPVHIPNLRLAPAAKQELDGEWEGYVDMLEDMVDRRR